jgi:hypothetical protein
MDAGVENMGIPEGISVSQMAEKADGQGEGGLPEGIQRIQEVSHIPPRPGLRRIIPAARVKSLLRS